MKNVRLNINLPLVGLALVFAFMAGYNSVAMKEPAVVGTVDVERMYQDLQEQISADESLVVTEKEHQDRLGEMRAEVERLQSELEFLEPDSPAYREMEEKLELATVSYAAYGEYAQQTLEMLKAQSWGETYLSIKKAAGEYANANGIDMVLLDDSIPPLKSTNTIAQVLDQISGRRMIYTQEELDITDELLDFMNTKFVAGANP